MLPPAGAIERYLAMSRDVRWFSNGGPCWKLLQARLGAAAGRDCVPVCSASLGLVVAIAALRERAPTAATEVLVPSFAFAASAQAAIWNGLRPVFVDVGEDHWHMDPDELECALAERQGRIAVVVALSSFGTPPPVEVRERWIAACANAGVPLVVDSAAGFGAVAEDGCPIGGHGDVEVVSFHATKPLAAGEGGAVFCRERAVAEQIRRLTNFGFDDDRSVVAAGGINAKMCEPVAAIALAALDGLPRALAARHSAAAEITARLPSGFDTQLGAEHGTWQFVAVRAPTADLRDAIIASACESVEIRTYYEPLHLMPAFAGCARTSDLPVTLELGARLLSLPMAVDLSAEERRRIAASCASEARASLSRG
jgi:dTDP-4-amino-4,6-dideoxygalactose transaminase